MKNVVDLSKNKPKRTSFERSARMLKQARAASISKQARAATMPKQARAARMAIDPIFNNSTLRANEKEQKKQTPFFKRRSLTKRRKKIKGVLGKIYCNATKNNTTLTLVDTKGNTKGWSCSGSLGFKNARKSTTYAAQAAAEMLIKKAKTLGYTHLRLRVKGLGRGKQSCLKLLSKSGLRIISLEDNTPLPHNGCRGPKKRRV